MKRIAAATLMAFSLLGCGPSNADKVAARYSEVTLAEFGKANTRREEETYASLFANKDNLTTAQKQAWLDAWDTNEKAQQAVRDIEAEGRAKGYQ